MYIPTSQPDFVFQLENFADQTRLIIKSSKNCSHSPNNPNIIPKQNMIVGPSTL